MHALMNNSVGGTKLRRKSMYGNLSFLLPLLNKSTQCQAGMSTERYSNTSCKLYGRSKQRSLFVSKFMKTVNKSHVFRSNCYLIFCKIKSLSNSFKPVRLKINYFSERYPDLSLSISLKMMFSYRGSKSSPYLSLKSYSECRFHPFSSFSNYRYTACRLDQLIFSTTTSLKS